MYLCGQAWCSISLILAPERQSSELEASLFNPVNSKTARETERLKKKKKVFILYWGGEGGRENVCFAFIYVCALCVSCSGGAQKRVSAPLELKPGDGCESLVGAGN